MSELFQQIYAAGEVSPIGFGWVVVAIAATTVICALVTIWTLQTLWAFLQFAADVLDKTR